MLLESITWLKIIGKGIQLHKTEPIRKQKEEATRFSRVFKFGNAIDNMTKTGTADHIKHISIIYFFTFAHVDKYRNFPKLSMLR